jgi:hypothetical protein
VKQRPLALDGVRAGDHPQHDLNAARYLGLVQKTVLAECVRGPRFLPKPYWRQLSRSSHHNFQLAKCVTTKRRSCAEINSRAPQAEQCYGGKATTKAATHVCACQGLPLLCRAALEWPHQCATKRLRPGRPRLSADRRCRVARPRMRFDISDATRFYQTTLPRGRATLNSAGLVLLPTQPPAESHQLGCAAQFPGRQE